MICGGGIMTIFGARAVLYVINYNAYDPHTLFVHFSIPIICITQIIIGALSIKYEESLSKLKAFSIITGCILCMSVIISMWFAYGIDIIGTIFSIIPQSLYLIKSIMMIHSSN